MANAKTLKINLRFLYCSNIVTYIYVLYAIIRAVCPMTNLTDLKFSQQDKDFILSRIKSVREFSNMKFPEFLKDFIVKQFENELIFFPCITHPVCFEGTFMRIVINKSVRDDKENKQLTEYSQIKYPPQEVASKLGYNRASMRGQSIFYGGFGNLPVTLETRPSLGDLYTVSKWKQKEGTLLNHFPIFQNQQFFENPDYEQDVKAYRKVLQSLDENVAEVTSELFNFITEVFMKKVDKNDKLGYLFSALFAKHYLTNDTSNVHCLYYPSVAGHFLSRNIACLPKTLDNYFECVEIHESVCIKEPDEQSQGWLSIRTSDAININPEAIGDIEWKLHISQDEYNNLKSKYKFV